MEHPDEAVEAIRHQDKPVNFICRELSKKRKLEEQLNLPLPKYKFNTKLGDSERECPLLDACSVCNDSSRSLDFVTLPETDSAVSEVTFVNESTVLASNEGKLDTNADIKRSGSVRYSIIREKKDGNGAKSSSLLQFNLDPADERPVSCSTGYSCISELPKHTACDASCSYNQLCQPTVNQSCNIPSNESCSSPHASTTFVGPELSEHSMCSLGRNATKKRTPTDLDCLHVNLKDCTDKEDKLYAQQSYLEHDQFNRCLSKDGTLGAEENDVNLLAIDTAETNSVGSLDSTIKPAIGKRHKSVNTTSGTWEFGSGSTKGSHIRAEYQLLASTDNSSPVEYGSSQNSLVCHSMGISSPRRDIGGSITSNETYKELDANDETYSERETLSNEISADITETLPAYVLSSGRVSHKKEEHRDSRPLTIDQDFEQYFSMLML
ncbi:uncharacterized protein LOC131030648 [Cryptomeria japonica]|uniref:uncharacterized protein LOC131030648 n=1 Tax=Cryptomeria japonica TaxID=3369 RepID=UPI0027DA8DDC|nr:uncharacterized protein LOC131030648 [Cryptomeria japonica]